MAIKKMLSAHLTCIPGASKLRAVPMGAPRYRGPRETTVGERTFSIMPEVEPSTGVCVVCQQPIAATWAAVGVK